MMATCLQKEHICVWSIEIRCNSIDLQLMLLFPWCSLPLWGWVDIPFEGYLNYILKEFVYTKRKNNYAIFKHFFVNVFSRILWKSKF